MVISLDGYVKGACALAIRTLSEEADLAALLREVHAAFDEFTDQLAIENADAQSIFASMAQAAFLAAVTLAASGQVPSAAMVTRGCVENALYGFYTRQHPELFDVWAARHRSDQEEQRDRVCIY